MGYVTLFTGLSHFDVIRAKRLQLSKNRTYTAACVVRTAVRTSAYKTHRAKGQLSQSSGTVKVEVDILGSPSLIIRTVSVDVKQH